MRILMTGATGFVGKKLGHALVQAGHEITVLSRNPDKTTSSLPFPCQSFAWNPIEELAPSAAFHNVDAIVHLAGEPVAQRWNDEAKKRIYESRVLGTKNLLLGLAESRVASVRTFVSASAIGIYGNRGDEELRETTHYGDDFLAAVCRDWEQATQEQAQLKLRRVCLRLGIVLGKEGGALEKMLPLFKLGLGGPVSTGKQWMSWIHIDDLISLFVAVLERPEFNGTYNAVAPQPVTNGDFTKVLASALKRPAFFRVPSSVLRLALGSMSEIVITGQRTSADRLLKSGFRFRFERLDQALKEITG